MNEPVVIRAGYPWVRNEDFVVTTSGERMTVTATPTPGLIEFISTNTDPESLGGPGQVWPVALECVCGEINMRHCPVHGQGDGAACPHGRLRESQWCPVCDR